MHESGEIYHSKATGSDLYRRVFTPKVGDPIGGMVMAHGLGDHLGCHVVAAEMFCGHGRLCAGVDWPGHGFSAGKRGHIDGVGAAIRSIAETCRFVREKVGPDAPLGFYAHSTGALFALHFLELNQQGSFGEPTLFDRIWLGSPLLRPQHGQHPVKVWGAGLIGKLAPRLIFDTHVRPERCRKIDPSVAKSKGDYDLCHHSVSAALGADMLRHGKRTESTARVLGNPSRVLITQGAEDCICPAEFSREFFENIPARQKTYALLPEMFHEPLREPDNTAVIEAVDRWMAD